MAQSSNVLLLFSITVLVAVCNAGIIEVENCSDRTNRVSDVEVDVSDCPSGNNCTLYKGSDYNLKTTFTPNLNFSDVNMRVLGVMGILKIPYTFMNDVCSEATTEDGENCTSEVGMLQGTAYTHVKVFPVRRLYPQISMRGRVEYYTGAKSTKRSIILCYEIPIQISNPPEQVEENEVNTPEQVEENEV